MAAKPSPGTEQHERVEDLAARVPSIQALIQTQSEVPLYQKFMDQVAPLITLPKSSEFVLEIFSSRAVTAERVALCFKANQYYQQTFYRVIESMAKRKSDDPPPPLESAIVLLGMQNSRNLILATQMTRLALGTHLEWTKEGKLKTQPKDLLKFALQAEEASANAKDETMDLAFAAGMLFDTLAMIASTQEHKKKLQLLIEAVYKHGFRAAQISAEIAKTVPTFSSSKQLFGATMVHGIGKIALGIVEPAYLDFIDLCMKKELSKPLIRYVERKRYGISHEVLGSVICQCFTLFEPISRAVLYQDEPFLLQLREKSLFELGALLSLSSNIASNFKKIDKADDPIIARWKGPELSTYKIPIEKIIKAVAKVP